LALGIFVITQKIIQVPEPYSKYSGFHHHSSFIQMFPIGLDLYGSNSNGINFYFIAPYFGSFEKENGAFISVSFYWLFASTL
jgi:hypothetical protein